MFRRKNDPTAAQTPVASDADDASAPSGKGRPTPKRKEAEAARRQNIAPPKDRREAKARMKAEKSKERQQTMEALRGGDERRYPVRDQGKGRHLARNWVDGRRNIGEFFWPIVIAALVLLFLPVPALQQGSTVVLLGFYVLITVDTGLSLLGLSSAAGPGSTPRARSRRSPPEQVAVSRRRPAQHGSADDELDPLARAGGEVHAAGGHHSVVRVVAVQ